MKLLLLLSYLLVFPALSSQDTAKVKMLINKVSEAENDYEKASSLIELSTEYRNTDPKKSVLYAKKAIEYAKKTEDKKLLAHAESAVGSSYYLLGDFDNSLIYLFSSLRLREEIQDTVGLSAVHNNIANVYNNRGDYDRALNSYRRSLEYGKLANDTLGNSSTSINVGNIYLGKKDFNKALSYFHKSLPIIEKSGDQELIVICYINMGMAYNGKENFAMAVQYFNKALKIANEINSAVDKIYALRGKAEAQLQAKQYDKALINAEESLKLALKSNGKDEIRHSASVLSKIYEETGDFEAAHKHLSLYAIYNDSITNEQVTNQIAEAQVKYETERKAKANLQLQTEHKLHDEEQQQKRIIQYVTIASLLLAGGVAFLLFKGSRRLQNTHKSLTEKNDEISITNLQLNTQQNALRRQSELLTNQKEELERLGGIKDRLFSVIAHDLRGPLVSLKGLLQVMSMGNVPEKKQEELFKSLVKGQQNVLWMLDNLFDWARAQMKGFEVERKNLNLHSLTEENIRLLLPIAIHKDIRIENRIQEDMTVYADREMMKLVLRNLISNAIKFCSSGDLILVSAFILDQVCTITVQDTGVGISEHVMQKLFNQSGYTSRGTDNEKGSGLGLSLCKTFIEQNGGTIWVESTLGVGSAFRFTLPVGETDLQETMPAQEFEKADNMPLRS